MTSEETKIINLCDIKRIVFECTDNGCGGTDQNAVP